MRETENVEAWLSCKTDKSPHTAKGKWYTMKSSFRNLSKFLIFLLGMGQLYIALLVDSYDLFTGTIAFHQASTDVVHKQTPKEKSYALTGRTTLTLILAVP